MHGSPGSVPSLAALLGTRSDFVGVPANPKRQQNYSPRNLETGGVTEAAPPLLLAISRDLASVGLPRFVWGLHEKNGVAVSCPKEVRHCCGIVNKHTNPEAIFIKKLRFNHFIRP